MEGMTTELTIKSQGTVIVGLNQKGELVVNGISSSGLSVELIKEINEAFDARKSLKVA